MKRLAFFILPFLVISATVCTAQAQSEEVKVLASIHQLFDAMRAADSVKLSEVLHPEVQMRTAMLSPEGEVRLVTENSPAKFKAAVGSTSPNTLDERLTSEKVQIDGPLAQVWTSYEFYVQGKFSHCGVNSFHLVKMNDKWLIVQLIDTRRKDNCVSN